MRATKLPSGEPIPVLGMGTWHMAEDPDLRHGELAALRLGLDLGMSLIDTAEMYAGGGAELLVAEAIAGRRDEVFLVSKVLPHHATRRGTAAACEGSLRRLRTDHLEAHVQANRAAVDLELTEGDLAVLDRAFPPPRGPVPLEIPLAPDPSDQAAAGSGPMA